MDMFRAVRGSLVMSWIPLITMEENMMTAAPPSTLWGMMDTMAASLGSRPHSTRNTAPQARAVRLTILVMVTRPTFWLKEVLGSTPNRAAKEEPRPSHMTPPASS